MARLPNVRLNLSNKPENVLLVRETLTGVAQAIGLDGTDLSDIRTAVTEACNNVVIHAYEGGQGPLEVEVDATDSTLQVIVRDRGVGIAHASPSEEIVPGIGLPVIEALSHSAEFREPRDSSGTEVHMVFSAASARGLDSPLRDGYEVPVFAEPDRPNTATVSIAPPALARAVLPRVLCVLAARAHFSTDRISDSQLVADALAAHAGEAISGGYLSMAVSVAPRDMELRVGPLIAGRAERLVVDSDVEGLGRVLEKLADRHGVTRTGAHDLLTLQLTDRR
jgi:anti-sigma regulatory factor (Ser/Thr protein kinase)